MRLLLNTHFWLWCTLEPHKLSSEVHHAVTDPSNRLRAVVRQIADDFALKETPLDWIVVHEMQFLMLGYNDPADRFPATTARAHDMTLVTTDQRLLGLSGMKVLPSL